MLYSSPKPLTGGVERSHPFAQPPDVWRITGCDLCTQLPVDTMESHSWAPVCRLMAAPQHRGSAVGGPGGPLARSQLVSDGPYKGAELVRFLRTAVRSRKSRCCWGWCYGIEKWAWFLQRRRDSEDPRRQDGEVARMRKRWGQQEYSWYILQSPSSGNILLQNTKCESCKQFASAQICHIRPNNNDEQSGGLSIRKRPARQ